MIIDGAGDILDKGSLNISSGTVNIKILDEIDVGSYDSDKDGIENLKLDTQKIFNDNI